MNLLDYKYKYTVIYVFAIIVANLGFSYLPLIPIYGGQMLAPMSFLIGFVFVWRDFAQREIGHYVIVAMLIGAVLSYLMADPYVAVASVVAFLISEFIDWAVYTFTGKPLRDRILYSSAVGTPIDSAVFMSMLGFFSWYGLLIMTISKMVGAGIIWYYIDKTEH